MRSLGKGLAKEACRQQNYPVEAECERNTPELDCVGIYLDAWQVCYNKYLYGSTVVQSKISKRAKHHHHH